MDCQLGIWEHDLQVKYFNSLYRHQWSTTNTIKTLHDQAQKQPINYKKRNTSSNGRLITISTPSFNLNSVKAFTTCIMFIPDHSFPQHNLLNRYHPHPNQSSIPIPTPRSGQSSIVSNVTAWPTSSGTALNITVDTAVTWHPAIPNRIAPKTDLRPMMMDSVGITISEEKKMGIWVGNAENAW